MLQHNENILVVMLKHNLHVYWLRQIVFGVNRQNVHRFGYRVACRIGSFYIILEFASKFADGVFNGPGGAVGQAANGRAGHNADRIADFQKQIQICQPSASGLDAIEHLQCPVRSFAAGSALAAAFVGEKPATIVEEIDNRVCFVQHHRATGSQPEAVDLPRVGKIQAGVQFIGASSRPVLSPPGTTALALRPFHTPPPNSSINCRQVMPSGAS